MNEASRGLHTVFQMGRYASVAAGSAITDYATFTVLLLLGLQTLPAHMVSRVAGGGFSFLSNRNWSFRASQGYQVRVTRQGARFLALYAFSYAVSTGLVYVLTNEAGWGAYPSKLAADGSCLVTNFLVMKFYVFK